MTKNNSPVPITMTQNSNGSSVSTVSNSSSNSTGFSNSDLQLAELMTATSKLHKDQKRKSILASDEYDSTSDINTKEDKSTTEKEDDLTFKITKSKLKHLRKIRYKKDGTIRSKFADIETQPRSSILDSEVHFGAKFYGFAVASWLCVFVFGLKTLVDSQLKDGIIFKSSIMKIMLKDLWKVGLTDLLMYCSTYFSVFIQLAVRKGIIDWSKIGVKFISSFEVGFVFFFLWFANYMDYPWIARIFLMLHSIVLLMKMHSYNFYNGYLWNISREVDFSERFLKKRQHDIASDMKEALKNSIEFCNFELFSQSKTEPFPTNINFKNFFWYSMFPTVVYEIDYPRNERIRKRYVLEKIAGIFGVILLMIAISQHHLYPLVIRFLALRETQSLWYRIKIYPLILLDFIPPFLCVYMLVFFLIWELILNAIAELTCFADREFYSYWWNSVDWNDYARDWNVPIHKFLLRHVYHSSISAFEVRKTTATLLTFSLSSIIHELAMYVIFNKLRGYLLILQMTQLPLVALSKTEFLKDKRTLGNIIFWFGIVFGPSLMCTMYLVF